MRKTNHCKFEPLDSPIVIVWQLENMSYDGIVAICESLDTVCIWYVGLKVEEVENIVLLCLSVANVIDVRSDEPAMQYK
jgi:hypothetical protein